MNVIFLFHPEYQSCIILIHVFFLLHLSGLAGTVAADVTEDDCGGKILMWKSRSVSELRVHVTIQQQQLSWGKESGVRLASVNWLAQDRLFC